MKPGVHMTCDEPGMRLAMEVRLAMKEKSMPRWIRDTFGSVVTLGALVLCLAAVDPRVSETLRAVSLKVVGVGRAPATSVERLAARVGPEGQFQNGYLMVFLGFGVVLVFLMLRT